MKTLYLIDNGRAIAYDLTVPQGVIVGLLGDQLVVATAVALPKPDGGLDPNIGAGGEAAAGAVGAAQEADGRGGARGAAGGPVRRPV